MKVLVEVEHCYELRCPWLKTETVYPADSFERPYDLAECSHPKAPERNILGSDDEMDAYCIIPEWCPKVEEDLAKCDK